MYKERNRLVVAQRTEELADYTFQMTDNEKRYAKKRRFTFVDRMQNLSLDIHSLVIEANELPVRERAPLQRKILAKLEVLIVLIEFSLKRGFIDYGECSRWTEKALETKRLAAAWMHRTK